MKFADLRIFQKWSILDANLFLILACFSFSLVSLVDELTDTDE